MTEGEHWWAELMRKMQRDPGYWSQAILTDLQLLWSDLLRMLRTALGRRR